jgi:hypothetical protein
MTLRRFLATWGALALLMSVNGIFRELVLRDALPGTAADLASALLGATLILLVTRTGFRALAGAPGRTLLAVSLAFVCLTVAFELVIGRAVDGKSWSELLADYAIWEGRPWPALLLLVALTPWIWGRWRARPSSAPVGAAARRHARAAAGA